MVYNTTEIFESKTLDTIFKSVNNLTNGLLFNMFLITLFLIILMSFPNTEFRKLLIADSFIIMIISFFGFILGLTNISIMILPLILLMGSIIYYFLTK